MELGAPLSFRPVYQVLVWGGRRMQRWRRDLPPGPIGESWDLADHDRGLSVVEAGIFAGTTLRQLTERFGASLVGHGFRGGCFPLMVKLIDAADKLSVQVHPDDPLARRLGVGDRGKTECWLILEDGGYLYQGTREGIDRVAFEGALGAGRLVDTLNRFDARAGDFFLLEARTVHALGSGCLLLEIQQTCDVTFRVYDWDRPGLDGKPRSLHVHESLETIDFGRTGMGPQRPIWTPERDGAVCTLVDGKAFRVDERRLSPHADVTLPLGTACAVVTVVSGAGTVATASGRVALAATRTVLVPAVAQSFSLHAGAEPLDVLVSVPRL